MLESIARFKVEYWYHVLMIVGAAGAIAAMTVELKGVANAHALLISLGVLFVGMGEWINHPLQTQIVPRNFYAPGGAIITSHPRNTSGTGVLFDLLGAVLIAIGVYKIVQAAQ